MTVKLTDRFLTSRKPPASGRVTYTDATVPGLTFRVSASTVSNAEGRRDWLLRYRPRGQTQKAASLGAYPAVYRPRNARLTNGEQRQPRLDLCPKLPGHILIGSSVCGHGAASKVAPGATSSRSWAISPSERLREPI
jgi:Arm DNA-binding domain